MFVSICFGSSFWTREYVNVSASINANNVKVYKCGDGEDNPNFDVDKCEKTNI
jgi:hypothetical protein